MSVSLAQSKMSNPDDYPQTAETIREALVFANQERDRINVAVGYALLPLHEVPGGCLTSAPEGDPRR
jgi:hypothetical protein